MLRVRGYDTIKVFKGKGHADQFMVADGSVRQEDFGGNDGADPVANLWWLRQNDDDDTSSRRAFLRTRRHWYTITIDLHKFMVPDSWINSIMIGKEAPLLTP